MSVLKAIVRLGRRIVDAIEALIEEIKDEPLAQRALEADLGLPPGALDKAFVKRPDMTGIDTYISSVDTKAEEAAVAIEALKAYAKFWTSVFSAIDSADPKVADELVYRLFQVATVDLIKFEHPRAYAFMRLLGVIQNDLLLTVEDAFAPEVPATILSGEFWRAADEFPKGYRNFRLEQVADFVPEDPDEPGVPDAERTRRRQLSFRVFGLSDLGFIPFFVVGQLTGKAVHKRGLTLDQMYGWERPPKARPSPGVEPPRGTGIPISDHIATRGYSVRLSSVDGTSATLTQLLVEEADGQLGWLFSLRGAVAFEEKAGTEERPVKILVTVAAPNGLQALLRFGGDDQFVFTGAPTAGMKLAIRPEAPATAAPAIALPDAKGTRLEIGDYSFTVDLSTAGFKVRASTKKTALVLDAREGDPLVEESLQSRETRIEFDLGLTADQNGISIDGGGRLAATIPLNKTLFGTVKVQTIQLALAPESVPGGSELQLIAAISFTFDLGPLHLTVEQIGLTFNVGSTRDTAPVDSLEVLTSLLYLRDLGFKPPAGIGIRVESGPVNGGGFLFHDADRGEYAGVLQLDFGERYTFTAIGLLTTKLPDGTKGYSFLIILSLEFDPPWKLWFGFTLSGLGGLLGIRRTLDADALRAGLRNRTLDAVLFPKDPIANAGRVVASVRTVFPPARDRHVAGPILRLGWGCPTVLTAELAVVYEWGASSRLAIFGQLTIAYPPKAKKKFLEINIDALGLWDLDKGDFALDARMYDSHIAFVKLAGDVALRLKSGDDAFFLFSAGGYHPEFAVPANFPKLERVKITLADFENLRLILTGYVAVSSNSRQVGAEMEFFAKFAGFTIESRISFDALWEPDVRFLVDFDIEAKIKYKGMTLLGVSVSGRFTGPEPKRVQGEWSIDLWLFSVSKSFDCTFGPDRPPAALPGIDPLPELVAALKDERNWVAQLPARSRMLVTLRSRAGTTEVLVHPLGELGVRQQVLPLGVEIDRFGGGVPTGERRFAITKAFIGAEPVTELRAVYEQFATGDFLDLDDDERIDRPSFEPMPAGVSLVPKTIAFGGQTTATAGQAAVSDIDFEEIVIDANGNTVRPAGVKVLSLLVTAFAVRFGPAARSPLRTAGTAQFRVEGAGFRVGPEQFTVTGVDDLRAVAVDGATATSHVAVRQALERHVQANPAARRRIQVVPAFRAEVSP